jgi:putative redox protein
LPDLLTASGMTPWRARWRCTCGWELGEIRIDLRVVEEGGAPRIERRIRIGAALPEEAQRRLLEIAGKTPVTRMIAEGMRIETRLG